MIILITMSGDFTYEDFKEYSYGGETWYEYEDETGLVVIDLVQRYWGDDMTDGWYLRINDGTGYGYGYLVDNNYEPYWFETPEDAIDELNEVWDDIVRGNGRFLLDR